MCGAIESEHMCVGVDAESKESVVVETPSVCYLVRVVSNGRIAHT